MMLINSDLEATALLEAEFGPENFPQAWPKTVEHILNRVSPHNRQDSTHDMLRAIPPDVIRGPKAMGQRRDHRLSDMGIHPKDCSLGISAMDEKDLIEMA
jgi:hypothetical protein